MAYIKEFGSYVPAQVISNEEIGAKVGCDAAWIVNVSGIEERRFANESVAELGWHAARECLDRSGMAAEELAMILVASSSAEPAARNSTCFAWRRWSGRSKRRWGSSFPDHLS